MNVGHCGASCVLVTEGEIGEDKQMHVTLNLQIYADRTLVPNNAHPN